MKITEHFNWDEVIFSETAARQDIDNTPPLDLHPNIMRMAKFMEQVRYIVGGRPIFISSWYRSPELNKAIGGSKTSSHMKGLACDCICPMLGSPLKFSKAIANSDLDYDQVINEFGRWVHIGLAEGNRGQLLTAYRKDGKTVYVEGLKEV